MASGVNPFDDEEGVFFVLINEAEQYSLWPTFKDVPGGWSVVFGESTRQECVDFIEKTWIDMRPKSIR